MKKVILWTAGILAAIAVLLIVGIMGFVSMTWDSPADNPVPALTASTDDETVARGEFLFKYSLTCWHCHSNTLDPDAAPSGGKHFDLTNVGPGFGHYYATNVTPDPETGIGDWSDGELVRALREGVGRNGTKLFPIMPAIALKELSDDDVLALVAYMKSLDPVRNPIPEREVSFAAKALWAFGLVTPEDPITETIDAPSQEDPVAYGKYLANNASLCYDCHSPRNLQDGSFYPDSSFGGSSIAFGEIEGDPIQAHGPNLTMDQETGIGSWSEDDFVRATRYGVRPDGRVLALHMPFAAYAMWAESDVRAVYAYLQTVPTIRRRVPPVLYSSTISSGSGEERGEALYTGACEGCHGVDGTGTAFTTIQLAAAAQVMTDEEIIDMVTNGELSARMPGFGKTFSEEQIADVLAYIRTMPEP